MKLAIIIALAAGCVQPHGTMPNDDGNSGSDSGNGSGNGSGSGSGGGSGSAAEPSLCESQSDSRAMYDAWAAVQPKATTLGSIEYQLDAIVEGAPEPTLAVRQREYSGSSWTDRHYLISLDAGGAVVGKSDGFYIDRIAPGRFLIDQSRATLNYVGSHDPLYYLALQLYAVDRTGAQVWRLAGSTGAVERSKVFRMDPGHWMILGLFNSNIDPVLVYFDAAGTETPPVAGDPRPCAMQ
jgi:hypothetical protein